MSAMQEYWRLLRLHVRMQAGFSVLSAKRGKRGGKETLKIIGLGFLILYAAAAILLFYSFILFPFMRGAADAGLAVPVMGIVVMICMLIVMLFGTLSLVSLVFGARDAESYASMPLRESSVFAAKFTVVYGLETGMSAVFLWPAVIIYGMVTHLSAPEFLLLILRALPVWLLLPAVPMAIAALLAMLFTRLTALAKRRDLLMLIFGMVLMLGMVFGQAMLSNKLAPTLTDPEQVMRLLSDNNEMLKAVTRAFPPAQWCSMLLAGETAADAGTGLIGMLASVSAGLFICLMLSRRLYYKGVLAQLEAPRGKTKGFSRGSVKTGSALKAFFFKEMKVILRCPVYAMNTLTSVVIFPLMFAVVSFTSRGTGSSGTEELRSLIDLLHGLPGGASMLVAAGVVMLLSVFAVGVSTSFSREGAMLWISQTVPVPVKTQVAARLLGGFVMSGAGSVLTLAAMTGFLGFTIPDVIFGFVAGTCASFPMLAAAIIPDAARPKRKWNSEAEAMKQNLNSVLAMLLDIGIALAIGFAAFGLQRIISVWAAGIILSLTCLAAGYALFLYASRTAERMMQTVDG